ncbi:MAG TPA: hypothetical protein V6C89_21235 [Drouetiella sp.]
MVHQFDPGGPPTELSDGSDVCCCEKERESENGAAGDSDGLNVTPGALTGSLLGADKFATSTTMMTKIPVATNIFTMLAPSGDERGADAELLRFVDAPDSCLELPRSADAPDSCLELLRSADELVPSAELLRVEDEVEPSELAEFVEYVLPSLLVPADREDAEPLT